MTAVLVEGAEENAFDPKPVQEKRRSGARQAHCLLFLISWDSRLQGYKDRVYTAFRTTLAKRRIPRGRRTRLYTLGTSNDNEATTRGTKNVFDDIFIKQLQMDPQSGRAHCSSTTPPARTIITRIHRGLRLWRFWHVSLWRSLGRTITPRSVLFLRH